MSKPKVSGVFQTIANATVKEYQNSGGDYLLAKHLRKQPRQTMTTKTFAVDSGSIYVAPVELLVKYGYNTRKYPDGPERLGIHEFVAKRDSITLKCSNAWNGKVEQTFPLEVGKTYVIADICYTISDDNGEWNKLLNDTNYLQEYAFKTGGDGSFKVRFNDR